MAERQSTELEHLEAGLGSAEDPYQIQELLLKEIEDLVEEVRREIRYSTISMIRAGRIFMAIKTKLPRGQWESFGYEQRWSWEYVRCSLKLLEVAARFPQALHLPPGRATQRLLRLSSPMISEIFDDLPPESIKKLTPWDIELIYDRLRQENRRARPRKPRPRIEGEIRDFSKVPLYSAITAANMALADLAAVEIEEQDFLTAKKFSRMLQKAFDQAHKHLVDPKHEVFPRG